MTGEVLADGRTVWVNDPTGCCIGRFSRFGIDVHRSFAEQAANMGECLHCTHERPDLSGWQTFREAMERHHAVTIAESNRPLWLA